ncbi:hypothetical protein [uncultured Maribacter sp.]|uniref:hypothetical protein n=1 Tax=uncultured Maribacter sp. TaxID=431308 RepID=UPI00261A8AD5|nr:hypothetical protein [uncultured Maribacter sp.]
MKNIVFLFVFLFSLLANAQVPSGGDLVGLHNVASTDLPSITGPIVGSILYNSTTEKIYIYKVGGWTTIGDSDEWKLDGNKLSNTNFLGSINAEDLVFKANNTERIRIKQSTGNIGIGTKTPNRKLEVNGIIRSGEASSTTGTTLIEGKYSGDNVTAIIGTKRSSGVLTLSYGVRPNNTATNYISSANNVAFQRSALEIGNGLSFQSTSGGVSIPINSVVPMNELFKISPNGNTGIGTSTPSYKLDVNGTAKIENTPTITTATKALVKNPATGQISEQVIPTFSSNKSYVQVYKGNKTFTNGNATLLNLFPEVTIQAGKKIKMTLYVPTRDNTNHWGGLYVNVNVRVNGTWYNLGNTGYDGGVMSYSAQSIHALNHEMLLDFITNLGLPEDQTYTLQFELRARSYNGTTSVNRSHDINRTANNLNVRGGLQTWASDQNYCHIIIEEKDR